MQVIANGTHHDFPGVEADAHLHSQRHGCGVLPRHSAEGRLHGERRITGPYGVILVSNGAPKRAMMPSPST